MVQLQDGYLSDKSTKSYWDDGFLFPIPAIAEEQAQSWRKELESVEDEWLDNDLPLPLNSYKRVNAHVVMPVAYQIGAHPAILDVVEKILGPNIMIYGVEFFIKEPNTKHIVSMHQDLTYWGLGEIDGMVTAWLALSPATSESGCMDMVQGSHKNSILPHEDTFNENNLLSRGQEIAVEVADSDKTAIEIMPGELSLHHGLMIHGSGPNSSDDRRIAAVIRYISPDIKPESETIPDYAMLVRGNDPNGHFVQTPAPTRNFGENSLALYEQIRKDQTKVKMSGAKSDGMYSKDA